MEKVDITSEKHPSITGKIFQFSAALSATSAVIALGANAAWSSPYLPHLKSNSSSIPTTDIEASWCAMSPLGGCLFGSFIGRNMVDQLGRKRSLLLLAPITFFSYVGMAFSNYIWYLTALRFTIGISDAAIFTVLPMYVGEIVDPQSREFLSSSIVFFFIGGTLIINGIGPFLDIYTSSLILAAFPAIHFLTFLFMPESPYYYVKIGDYENAERSLKKFTGLHDVNEELCILKESHEMEREISKRPKLIDLFTIPSNRKAFFIYFILMFALRASGKTPIQLFTKTIFEATGSSIDANLSVISYSLVEFIILIIVTLFVTKKFGKRPLMIISASGSSVCLFAVATYFYLKSCDSYLIHHIHWLPLGSLVCFNIFFNIGIGFGQMTYLSELFPMNVKANASCLAQFLNIVFALVMSHVFTMTIEYGFHIPFYIFSILLTICVIFIYKYVPETRGKTLEEIQSFLIQSSKLVPRDIEEK